MGFDKGRKGDRGGRGRDKRDDFFGGEQPHGDFGFQERPAYCGGGPCIYGGHYPFDLSYWCPVGALDTWCPADGGTD